MNNENHDLIHMDLSQRAKPMNNTQKLENAAIGTAVIGGSAASAAGLVAAASSATTAISAAGASRTQFEQMLRSLVAMDAPLRGLVITR